MKSGICVAGTVLVDNINQIATYPKAGELTNILSCGSAVGGCVPNVAADLKKIEPSIPIYAMGKTGKDAHGKFVKDFLTGCGVNTELITECDTPTSFTDVMSVLGGERTFFTYAGANDEFGFDDFDFEAFPASHLHLGYFMLLKKVDGGEGEKIFKAAKSHGIVTSLDMVSSNVGRYADVIPVLKYTDNIIVNELEAGNLAGIEPSLTNLRAIAQKIKDYGVSGRVIIHAPKISVCLSGDGFTELPSYDIPNDYIVGTTGAGDAFCSGALIGIYDGMSDIDILTLATRCATVSLRTSDAVSGLVGRDEMVELCSNFNRRNISL